jgi:hypothetical protein
MTPDDDTGEDDARRLLALGLGGKRHMGCGVFLPTARHLTRAEPVHGFARRSGDAGAQRPPSQTATVCPEWRSTLAGSGSTGRYSPASSS